MEGTRKDIFETINDWLDDPNAHKNILWIKGSPGAGKSAIASSLVSQLRAARRLGGSFSFRRGDTILSNPASLWRTVAFDLARFNSDFASAIVSALKDGRVDPLRPDIKNHFDVLIKQPLKSVQQDQSYLAVVVDALDECGDASKNPQRKNLISTLTQWSTFHKTMKLIITSRDDRLPESFREVCQQIVLPTGDKVTPTASADIDMFFTARFEELKEDFPSLAQAGWPGSPVMHQLTTRAAGLFIWAETVMRFIEEGNPEELLTMLLSGGAVTGQDDVNNLYRQVATHALVDIQKHESSQIALQPLLRSIVFAKVPLSRDQLQYFMVVAVSETAIDLVLRDFKSVITIDEDRTVRISHLSFVEFLLESDLCPELLHIPGETAAAGNLDFLRSCLRIMADPNYGLRFNICMLETSYRRNEDIDDLEYRIKKYIAGHLSYACRYWGPHLVDAVKCLSDCDWLLGMLWAFFRKQLLHWLEVTSLHHDTGNALTMLDLLVPILLDVATDLGIFAQDARQFIAHFETPISESVPHIYISALPLAPEGSLVSQTYLPHFQNTLEVVSGKDKKWTALLNVLKGHKGDIKCVAFSPDGLRIASGSHDNTIIIWDVFSGHMLGSSPLEGHSEPLASITFSPDGSILASSSLDHTIRIWSVVSGQPLVDPILTYTPWVHSIVFSSDGSKFTSGSDGKISTWETASGLLTASPFEGYDDHTASMLSPGGFKLALGLPDNTIEIWEVASGKLMTRPLQGHSDRVGSITFSSDESTIASGSYDKTVRIWDVVSGNLVVGPLHGHNGYVWCIAFSPDGSKIASGSIDCTVRVWDTISGQLIAGPFQGHNSGVRSITFSPDGLRLASGSLDKTIRIWDVSGLLMARPEEAGPLATGLFQGHESRVTSIAFSPNESRLVSGCNDTYVRIWESTSGQLLVGPLQGHKGYVHSVAFSPDGTKIASGSSDRTIRIWNVSGELVAGPLEGHHSGVHSVAFSPNGLQLASGSGDKTIRIWDVLSGQLLVNPFQGHCQRVLSVAFSPDGSKLASASYDTTVRIWDLTGQLIAGPFHCGVGSLSFIAFSPDGLKLASGSLDKTVRIWDVIAGKVIAGPLEHNGIVTSVLFSPDGSKLASGSSDQTIRIWDCGSWLLIGQCISHSSSVTSIAFSPDGLKLASGSGDKTIRIWNIASQPVANLVADQQALNDGSTAVTLSPTGSKLAKLHKLGDLDIMVYMNSFPDDSGWILFKGITLQKKLLYWIPPSCLQSWSDFRTTLVIPQPEFHISYKHFVHGIKWTSCYTGGAGKAMNIASQNNWSILSQHHTQPHLLHHESTPSLSESNIIVEGTWLQPTTSALTSLHSADLTQGNSR
ncbi:hypothetical protein SERLA73DRAFT_95850, partial [Serpula lacrymans var. lacrymans S7.3]